MELRIAIRWSGRVEQPYGALQWCGCFKRMILTSQDRCHLCEKSLRDSERVARKVELVVLAFILVGGAYMIIQNWR